jgi:hypothetical protein
MMALPFREKNDDWRVTLTILWHDSFQGNKLRGMQLGSAKKLRIPWPTIQLLIQKALFREPFQPGKHLGDQNSTL